MFPLDLKGRFYATPAVLYITATFYARYSGAYLPLCFNIISNIIKGRLYANHMSGVSFPLWLPRQLYLGGCVDIGFLAHSAMKLLKILCLFFLLGSDFQLKPASLEAKIPPAPKCDGRWNVLFAPQSPWVLQRLGGAATLVCLILAAVVYVYGNGSIHLFCVLPGRSGMLLSIHYWALFMITVIFVSSSSIASVSKANVLK